MRYQSKSSIAYMFRNFWQLILVALPVSLSFAFFMTPDAEINFVRALIDGELNGGNLLTRYISAVTVLRYGKYWWTAIINVVLFALTVSVLVVKIDRHMRVGEISALPLKSAFKLFPVTLLLTLCCVATVEVLALLSVGVMMLLRFADNVTVVACVSLAVSVIVRLIETWMFMLLLPAFPLKYSEHCPLNVAFSYSARIMSKHKRITWGISFAFVFARMAIVLLGALLAPYRLDVPLYCLAYVFTIAYTPCLAYKLYYDEVGGERRDVREVIFL